VLAQLHRLRRDSEIKGVVRSGRCFVTPHIRVCVLPSNGPVRIACVCGKSVSALAVARHKYQRWLRSLAKEIIVELGADSGCDMVWVARPGIAGAKSIKEIQQDLWKHLPEIKNICGQ
jgi:ribonuclease P protein component